MNNTQTPRTDEHEFAVRDNQGDLDGWAVNVEFARQLERELADANEKAAMAEAWERRLKDSEDARNIMRHSAKVTLANPLSDIISAMRLYGGSFVNSLSYTMRLADAENLQAIIQAFPAIMERYDAMAGNMEKESND